MPEEEEDAGITEQQIALAMQQQQPEQEGEIEEIDGTDETEQTTLQLEVEEVEEDEQPPVTEKLAGDRKSAADQNGQVHPQNGRPSATEAPSTSGLIVGAQ